MSEIMECSACGKTTAEGLELNPSGKTFKRHKDGPEPCTGGKPQPYEPEPVAVTPRASKVAECVECGEEHPALKTPGKVRKHTNPQTLATCEQRSEVAVKCPVCDTSRTLRKMRLPVHKDLRTKTRCRASSKTMAEASQITKANPVKPEVAKPKPAPKQKAPKVQLSPLQQAVKKATNLGDRLKRYDPPWRYKVLTGESDQDENQATLVLTRGTGANQEEMRISWWGGACYGGEGRITHTYRGRTIAVRNASAICQRGMMTPEEVAAEYNRVVAKKATGVARAKKTPEEMRVLLPFDPAKAKDDEILKAVLGKPIAWENRTSGKTEKDVVKGKPAIKLSKNGRNLTFKGQNSTRTIRVENLVSVG